MWFKNLSIFRLTEEFTLAPADLELKLEQMA
ncbi:MAG: recombination-associated protein RdgC, partial [Methylobacter sp.]